MAEASPLLRQLVIFNYSFVTGKPDTLQPDFMPFAIVERVSGLVRSQQQAVAAVVTDQAQREMHLRFVDLMRGATGPLLDTNVNDGARLSLLCFHTGGTA